MDHHHGCDVWYWSIPIYHIIMIYYILCVAFYVYFFCPPICVLLIYPVSDVEAYEPIIVCVCKFIESMKEYFVNHLFFHWCMLSDVLIWGPMSFSLLFVCLYFHWEYELIFCYYAPCTMELLYPTHYKVFLGYIRFTLSVRPSVRPAFCVRSVISTVLDGFPYKAQMVTNMRGCVVHNDLWPWLISLKSFSHDFTMKLLKYGTSCHVRSIACTVVDGFFLTGHKWSLAWEGVLHAMTFSLNLNLQVYLRVTLPILWIVFIYGTNKTHEGMMCHIPFPGQ